MNDQENQVFTSEDIEKNKIYAALAYLGFLFFLPLVIDKDSAYGKFHANQGLVLFIAEIIVSIIFLVPFAGWIVGFVLGIALLVFMIIGMVNAINGKGVPLPIIGGINLINK